LIQQEARILANDEVNPGVFLMAIHSPEVASRAQPGQFLYLRIIEGPDPLMRRPLSIFKVDADDGSVSLLFRVVGRGTLALSGLRMGESLDIIGPLGRGFSVPPRTRTTLVVAGGIGVAPLFFLAESLIQRGMLLHFLLGARTQAQLLCRLQLRNLGVHLMTSTDDGSEGFPGLVTQLLEKFLLQESFGPHSTFVCSAGPEPMLSQVSSLARKFGILGQISMEQQMACGVGACLGCVVACRFRGKGRRYRRVCTDGPVFGLEEIAFQQ